MKRQWRDGIAEWIEGDTAYISVVFSWKVQKAYMRCVWHRLNGYHVRCGGQAVYMNPSIFREFDTQRSNIDAISHHNPNATFTSRGCIRKCSFCLVPKMEGKLIELENYPIRPIICDNNLLATSSRHFNKVIDNLLEYKLTGIDFNQGLDARILNNHHASRLSELPRDTIVRLAWDNIKTESQYLRAVDMLISHGIKEKQIRTYVLIGYKDSPDDAYYRLEKIRELGLLPNPMRYQPINTKKKNSFVDEKWTGWLLTDFMRYYSNLNRFGYFEFNKYRYNIGH